MMGLAKYRNERLVVTQSDAWKILFTFWPDQKVATHDLDENDRRSAQALVLEAAEASAKMGMVEQLWRTAASPTVKPTDVFKTAAKSVIGYLRRDQSLQAAVSSDKYAAVIATLARNFRSVWALRVQTGDTSDLLA